MKGVSPSLKRVTVLNDPCEKSFRTEEQTLEDIDNLLIDRRNIKGIHLFKKYMF